MAIVYVDMDNVIVDFKHALRELDLPEDKKDADNIEGIFARMVPMPGAVDGFNELVRMGHDVYILSTAPWNNPSAWSDKLIWVKKYLGENAYKKLILSHHKNLNAGDYLIDDRLHNGAIGWERKGRLLRFGYDDDGIPFQYPNWDAVLEFFRNLPR